MKVVCHTFSYFLDAWKFCTENSIDWQSSISKLDWKTWLVQTTVDK